MLASLESQTPFTLTLSKKFVLLSISHFMEEIDSFILIP